jgi:hypothetical protein
VGAAPQDRLTKIVLEAEIHRLDPVPVTEAECFGMSGLVLFGARWKAPLARALGVSRETVSRWVSAGDIPKWAANTVALLSAGKGSVLSLCDRTGNMVQPWAAAGFECFCVDLRHGQGEARDGITYIGADIREWLPPPRRYAIVFAFPPCTALAVSGARWFKGKGMGGLTEAIELVEACRRIAEWSAAPWMIENPVSTLGSYWRKPDFSFHPYEFWRLAGWRRRRLWEAHLSMDRRRFPLAAEAADRSISAALHSQPAAVRQSRRSAQHHPAGLCPRRIRGECRARVTQQNVTLWSRLREEFSGNIDDAA